MTYREKCAIYEQFLHRINLALVTCNDEQMRDLIERADNWSYAHRRGNGERSTTELKAAIDTATRRLIE